jgi:trans-2,3-dihydro-3-hydroxyanthranilate isomerase
MKREYFFRLLNVFTETTFGGNQLCVFEDGSGLSTEEMQALARQFNLSETTFVLPSEKATARIRIFTTGYEMPFAGHPTLGSAEVVRSLKGTPDRISLEFAAGVVPVFADRNTWSFVAPSPPQGKERVVGTGASRKEIAELLGLDAADLLDDPVWANMGADQLLIPVKTVQAVRRASPNSMYFPHWPQSSLGRKTAYVFAFEEGMPDRVLARYFFTMQGGGVSEDPGTGSACANLGAWLLHAGRAAPFQVIVNQGKAVHRPSRLLLTVNEKSEVMVGGSVIELGRGSIFL